MLTSSGGGGRSMLTVADRGRGGGVKFAKILLTSYVNTPLVRRISSSSAFERHISTLDVKS